MENYERNETNGELWPTNGVELGQRLDAEVDDAYQDADEGDDGEGPGVPAGVRFLAEHPQLPFPLHVR